MVKVVVSSIPPLRSKLGGFAPLGFTYISCGGSIDAFLEFY